MFKSRFNKKEINCLENTDIFFDNLAPIDNAKIDSNTEKALDYAFNDKNIKNIGVTGIYSSGKSSIIKTYLKKKKMDKKSLVISLAKFEQSQNQDIVEVEKEIIEKLYYSKGAHPIKHYLKRVSIEVGISIGIMLSIYVLNYQIIDNLWNLKKISLIGSILITLIILCIIVHILINIYSRYNFRFNIGNIKLEIEEKKNAESILNKYIDFIIKIVKEKQYKNFIFEDIDRFKNDKLLLNRLRDLNETLNEKENIKFLYEIKDGEFENNTRTKFFDFIVPIVPYVSFGTSNSLLDKLIEKNHLENELSKEFISDICLFINDPRLLINILNEYLIYKDSINNLDISYENLFVYIVYKNIFPDDFGKLQDGYGNLYDFLKRKREIANNVSSNIKADSLKYNSPTVQNYKELMDYFVKEDLFDENYEIYICRFYSGSITKEENSYLTEIKRNIEPRIDYQIKNINNFMKKLFNKDYEKESCINAYIFDELLKLKEKTEVIKVYKNTIIKSNYYIEMLYKLCIMPSINKENCLSEFVKTDTFILEKIQNSQLQENEKIEVLEQIVLSCSIEDLKKLVNIQDVIKYMGNNNLLIQIQEKDFTKLENLKIKYKKISVIEKNEKLYKFCIMNNLYEINLENIFNIVEVKEGLERNNLDIILNNTKVKKYILENINEYIKNVYSKLSKQQDTEESIIQVLNNKNLILENGIIIIKNELVKYKDITLINQKYWKALLEHNSIEINEKNIKNYIDKYNIDENVVEIFNNEIEKILKFEMKLLKKENFKAIILNDNITIESFKKIVNYLEDIQYNYNHINNIRKNIEKMECLIKKNMIVDIFSYLKQLDSEFNTKRLRIAYIDATEKYDKINNLFNKMEIDEILNETSSMQLANNIIQYCNHQIDETNIALNVIRLNLSELTYDILKKIIVCTKIKIEDKIKIINLNFKVITVENLEEILNHLGNEYSRIIINGRKSELKQSESNLELINNIKNLGYKIIYNLKDTKILIRKNKKI